MFCKSLFAVLSPFRLVIVLSVVLQYTDSDYLFGIFMIFLASNVNMLWYLLCKTLFGKQHPIGLTQYNAN